MWFIQSGAFEAWKTTASLLWIRGIRTLLLHSAFFWLLFISWLRSSVRKECSLVCGSPQAAALVN